MIILKKEASIICLVFEARIHWSSALFVLLRTSILAVWHWHLTHGWHQQNIDLRPFKIQGIKNRSRCKERYETNDTNGTVQTCYIKKNAGQPTNLPLQRNKRTNHKSSALKICMSEPLHLKLLGLLGLHALGLTLFTLASLHCRQIWMVEWK